MMHVLITGADGFIGKNLRVALGEHAAFSVLPITRASSDAELAAAVAQADAVVHLAGVNRPQDPAEFATGNADFTARLCALLTQDWRALPVAFASSVQAVRDNAYGTSNQGFSNPVMQPPPDPVGERRHRLQRRRIRTVGAQEAQQAKAQHQHAAGDAHGTALHLRAQPRAQQAHAQQGGQGAQAEGAHGGRAAQGGTLHHGRQQRAVDHAARHPAPQAAHGQRF